MDLVRFDLVNLVDLDFMAERLTDRDLSRLGMCGDERSPILAALERGFAWLFYPSVSSDGRDHSWLTGTRRFDLSKMCDDLERVNGATVLVAQEFGVGVLAVWRKRVAGPGALPDPMEAKWGVGADDGLVDRCVERLRRVLPIRSCEREYPLLALRVRARPDELDRFCDENATELGRLFTGDYERQSPAQLAELIRGSAGRNISTRGVERLYMRWTDALAVYSDAELPEPDYECLMFRAAQVYETCILARRCVMTLATRMERSTSPWPFRHLEAAARLRRELEVSLPIQSDEALGLMSTAYDRFGMGRLWALLDDARKGLESRSQWRKAQLVALVGVLTYLLDKLGVLGLLSRRMLPP